MDDDELMLPGMTERELHIRRRVHRLAEFYRHVFVFVLVIGLFWAVNAWFVLQGEMPNKWYSWWAFWPTAGWGIGLITHGLSVLPVWSFFSQDWEDQKVKEMLARDEQRSGK